MRDLNPSVPKRILVRGTNWVGDAIMTLPALKALVQSCPQASINVLTTRKVQAIYENVLGVNNIIPLNYVSNHCGPITRLAIAKKLKNYNYDWSVLFQNAFEAALITYLAQIPIRVGYSINARKLLLTNPISRIKRNYYIHETAYYLYLLYSTGIINTPPPDKGIQPYLPLNQTDINWALNFLDDVGLSGESQLLGLAPGASFGPAKRWPAQYFSETARQLMLLDFKGILLFGNNSEVQITSKVATILSNKYRVINLAGITNLGQALALLACLSLFITNDSGLMHAAAAQGVPTIAIFGSTNPATTAPLGPWVSLVYKPIHCSPCLRSVCSTGLRCLINIEPTEVTNAAITLLSRREKK